MIVKRNTIQRRLIYESVKDLGTHPTAEEVYRHVAKKYPAISKATVYRNLSQMAVNGELLNIGSLNGSVRYDHNCHNHCHFMCDKCKTVFDVDAGLPKIDSPIDGLEKFEITGHTLIFTGLCPQCGSGHRGDAEFEGL